MVLALVAGHSMGGGTAAMLTMMMREKVGPAAKVDRHLQVHLS
jgi:acetyl esterase/lipase